MIIIRWPDIKRIREIAAVSVGLLLLVLVSAGLAGLILSRTWDLQDRLRGLAASVQAAQEKVAAIGGDSKRLAGLERQLAADGLNMDWEVRRGINYIYLGKLAAGHGLTLVDMKPQATRRLAGCLEYALDVTMCGDYDRLVAFIQGLDQEMPNATLVRQLEISRKEEGSAQELLLNCQLVTFLKEKPSEMRLTKEWPVAVTGAFTNPLLADGNVLKGNMQPGNMPTDNVQPGNTQPDGIQTDEIQPGALHTGKFLADNMPAGKMIAKGCASDGGKNDSGESAVIAGEDGEIDKAALEVNANGGTEIDANEPAETANEGGIFDIAVSAVTVYDQHSAEEEADAVYMCPSGEIGGGFPEFQPRRCNYGTEAYCFPRQ